MRSVVLFALATFAACGNNKVHEHRDTPLGPAYWTPMPGEAKNWDIQIHAPIDVSAERAMYIVDLFSVVPAATTIDYGDGDPVQVPAGAQAGAMATLASRPETTIVCRVGVAAIRLTDPDARKFPGYLATGVPNDPDPPASGSVIGWSTNDPNEPDERFLDPAQLDAWKDLVFARFTLAQQIGCDAIEPHRQDLAQQTTGFPDVITMAQQSAIYSATADAIHARELSAGMHVGTVAAFIDIHVADYDWLVIERCGENRDCDTVRAFLNARKAVFAIDYPTNFDGDPNDTQITCGEQEAGMITDGLVKDVALSSALRTQCVP